jgi:DNA-binding NarL/FixJ family response regulator
MDQHSPIIILEDQPHITEHYRKAFSILLLDNPLHFFARSLEMNSFLDEQYPPAIKKRKPFPALFILDYQLSETAGSSNSLRSLKTHPLFCSVPAIIFSDSVDSDHVANSYGQGCSGFFVKPATAEEYVKVLDVVLRFWKQIGDQFDTGRYALQ